MFGALIVLVPPADCVFCIVPVGFSDGVNLSSRVEHIVCVGRIIERTVHADQEFGRSHFTSCGSGVVEFANLHGLLKEAAGRHDD